MKTTGVDEFTLTNGIEITVFTRRDFWKRYLVHRVEYRGKFIDEVDDIGAVVPAILKELESEGRLASVWLSEVETTHGEVILEQLLNVLGDGRNSTHHHCTDGSMVAVFGCGLE